MDGEDSLIRRKVYKHFLEPKYKKSNVDPRTHRRWRDICMNTHVTTNKLEGRQALGIIFVFYNYKIIYIQRENIYI